MSAHGFRSLYMAAGVAGAALGCYLVSLNVASERSKLEAVEAEIASTQRDIRVLQTEIGTRGRLAQLERWNANFIRLSAPSADQFLEGGFQLATMVKPQGKPAIDAPVMLAAAPKPDAVKRDPATDEAGNPAARSAGDMMHVVGYAQPPSPRTLKPAAPAAPVKAEPVKKTETAAGKPSTAKGAKIASADPLAPLSAGAPTAKAAAPGADKSRSSPKASPKPKDSGTPQ
jgi:hypothetical protein